MKKQRVIILILLLIIASSFNYQGKWVIDSQSNLTIYGATNINTFVCSIDKYTRNDTLRYSTGTNTEVIFARNKMIIPIKNFDCGNRQITKDFWATLKSEDYPELTIEFKSLQNVPTKSNTYINGKVEITLAGACSQYDVRYQAVHKGANTLHLQGAQSVNFSDFKLKAPQKVMGLVQVHECLDVEFNLVLKSIP